MRLFLTWLPRRARIAWPRAIKPVYLQQQPRCWISSKANDKHTAPLRILFCGTDEFSAESLKALHEESKAPDNHILSIDVVTKKDKYTGRGNKKLFTPFIKPFALDLGLPVHQIDTFTGWQPPVYDSTFNSEINLIVAVSFGLLIPMRIINGAAYGGLNVHPSMLPDLRGPAPIQWAIIRGLSHTGVSVQTLHPTKFDGGIVLDQTPYPGMKIPRKDTISIPDLTEILARLGADLLVNAIRNKLYVPPYEVVPPTLSETEVTLAPRINLTTRSIDFQTMSRDAILRRNRGTGYRHKLFAGARPVGSDTELIIINISKHLRIPTSFDIPLDVQNELLSIPKGVPYTIIDRNEDIGNCQNPLFVNVTSDQLGGPGQLVIPEITIPSKTATPAARTAAQANLFEHPAKIGPYLLFRFAHPLSHVRPVG